MSEIKFPNNSFKPKQLFHRLSEQDELEHAFVFGIKKDGTIKWETSSTSFQFLAMAASFTQGLAVKGAIPVTDEPKGK